MNKHSQQSGYVLLTAVVLLAALTALSVQFMGRSTQSAQSASYDRDAAEALQLAESSMNWLYGQFTYGGDMNNDKLADSLLTNFDPTDMATVPFKYLYYVGDAKAIKSTQPSILQLVADGESRNKGGSLKGAQLDPTALTLRVDDLFNGNSAPMLFSEGANGLVVDVNSASFEKSEEPRKAAVWIELVNAADGSISFYAQGVAKVGNSTSYVQRYMGQRGNTLGTFISAVNEAH